MLARNLLYAYLDTQCIYAINALNIADHLEKKPLSISELAKKVAVSEDKLYRIMRYLSCKGIFEELPNQFFQINLAARSLLSSECGNIKDLIAFHADSAYGAATAIKESLCGSQTPFTLKYGMNIWQYLEQNLETSKFFNNAMQQNASVTSKMIIKKYDFSGFNHIIDIGGGVGSLLINILSTHSKSQGTIYDIPALKQKAEILINDSGLENRCQFIAGDFLKSIPEGGDLYLMKSILHGKNDEGAIVILSKCYDVMLEESKLLLIERVLDQKYDYLDGCINDMNMLNLTSGKERTLVEYKNLLTNAHLKFNKCIQIEKSLCLIEAEKLVKVQ